MSLLEGIIESPTNPLGVVEDIATDNNWAFERSGEDEVTIVSRGDWTDYQLSFTWMAEIEALHLACAFDMKIPPARRAEVQRLIAAVNEQLWIGHFDIWTHTGMVMYRQALVLPGGLNRGGSHERGDVRYRRRGVVLAASAFQYPLRRPGERRDPYAVTSRPK